MQSRYQTLQGRQEVKQKEYFEGFYQDKMILIDRNFRGHRLSDEECQALCMGEWIEIHNLSMNAVAYGVRGKLERDFLTKHPSQMPVYVFKSKMTLNNDPNYRFEDRAPYFGPGESKYGPRPEIKQEAYDAAKLQTSRQPIPVVHKRGEMPDEEQYLREVLVDKSATEEDAKLAAALAADEYPGITETKDASGLTIWIPTVMDVPITEVRIQKTDEKIDIVSEDVQVAEETIVSTPVNQSQEEVPEVVEEYADYEPYDTDVNDGTFAYGYVPEFDEYDANGYPVLTENEESNEEDGFLA